MQDHAITITQARPQDREALYRLTNELEGSLLPYGPFCAMLDAVFASRADLLLVARAEGAPVGYLHMRTAPQLHHAAPTAEILELVVTERFRGGRVGAQLLEQAAETARAQGAALLEVTSNLHRARAHRFYERHGFEKTSCKLVRPL